MADDYGGLRNKGEQMMAMASASSEQGPGGREMVDPPWWDARRLLRAARVGTIATSARGQPFASLITPACMPDGALLLLISRLSEHTRHLMADPRCSIMVSGPANSPNPQTTPRVTVTGEAVVTEDRALKARYLAVHPYAALYAGFTDFSTWRIAPAAALLVAGFGRAHRLKASDLSPEPDAVAAIASAEAEVITRCNQHHLGILAIIAGEPGDWRLAGIDVDGFDLAHGDRVLRFAWPAPIKDPARIEPELTQMAQAMRT
jgi:putative heme iron utilization protein